MLELLKLIPLGSVIFGIIDVFLKTDVEKNLETNYQRILRHIVNISVISVVIIVIFAYHMFPIEENTKLSKVETFWVKSILIIMGVIGAYICFREFFVYKFKKLILTLDDGKQWVVLKKIDKTQLLLRLKDNYHVYRVVTPEEIRGKNLEFETLEEITKRNEESFYQDWKFLVDEKTFKLNFKEKKYWSFLIPVVICLIIYAVLVKMTISSLIVSLLIILLMGCYVWRRMTKILLKRRR
ncbi:hypothetical protein Hs30E_07450 [Lactococcus hodotermopsidis]|uniref:Uncharacterized protein n=1 Tax=Pseudolactococcus hodotermopsidis TaxID=2709157 RepID=A0A6A0BCN9_9LACT|nr:hypothetical protein [Lactococcus hodotermopsidis]GFH42194.1 hypothetical protein Hs30E_07450 [Lactococcus hodotermopsidis]